MTQRSFSRLWDKYDTDAEAKAARDADYFQAKRAGLKARRSVLKNQLRQYWSLGVPCGETCDVYMLEVSD